MRIVFTFFQCSHNIIEMKLGLYCVSVVRPSGVYLLGRPGWREPLCLTPSTLKHSRTLLHLLAQRLPLSEWPRCSTESAAHDSTTARYYMFFNTGPTSLELNVTHVTVYRH